MFAITANRLSTIQRVSRSLQFFFIIMAVFAGIGPLITLTHPQPQEVELVGIVFSGPSITDKIHALWIVQNLLSAALSVAFLYYLVRLMGLYSAGKLFTAHNVTRIRQLGITSICALLVWLVVLVGAAPEVAAAQNDWVKIMPTFPMGSLIFGAILLFASRIVNEGRELREEQDLVV